MDGLAEELAALARPGGRRGQRAAWSTFFTQRVACCDVKLWPALEPLLPVSYDLESLYRLHLQLQHGELTAQLFGLGQDGRDANSAALGCLARRARRAVAARGQAQPGPRTAAVRAWTSCWRSAVLAQRADELEALGLELLREARGAWTPRGPRRRRCARWQRGASRLGRACSRWSKSAYDNAQELIRYGPAPAPGAGQAGAARLPRRRPS